MNAENDLVEETVEQVPAEVVPTNTAESTDEKVNVEEFTISGNDLVVKVKELIHEGNIRRIIIKNDEGRILIEIPLTVGVVGGVLSAALFPVIAAVGVIGAMVAHLTIVIEKRA
jgi:CBS domain-containing protein